MTYEEFFKKYEFYLDKMLSYESHQVGVAFYAEKLGELVDSVDPSWEERADSELEAAW